MDNNAIPLPWRQVDDELLRRITEMQELRRTLAAFFASAPDAAYPSEVVSRSQEQAEAKRQELQTAKDDPVSHSEHWRNRMKEESEMMVNRQGEIIKPLAPINEATESATDAYLRNRSPKQATKFTDDNDSI